MLIAIRGSDRGIFSLIGNWWASKKILATSHTIGHEISSRFFFVIKYFSYQVTAQ